MYQFKKIFGLAGAAVVFAGLASAQVTCNVNATSGAILVRAEGTAEQVADVSFTCTNPGAAQNVSILSFLSLPVNSKVLQSSTGLTEASVVLSSNPNAVTTQGTVVGNQITFSSVPLPTGTTTITVTNVRVNASSLNVSGGTPPAITETVFISGGVGVIAQALNPVNVGFALNGLTAVGTTVGTTRLTGINNQIICNGSSGANIFTVNFGENFPTAFKTQNPTGAQPPNNTVGANFTNNTETGFVPTAGFPSGGSNVANSGTRVKIIFTGVPTGGTIFVPQVITAVNGLSQLVLTASETGAFSAVSAAASSTGAPSGYGAVSLTSGGGTAVYEAVGSTAAPQNAALSDQFQVPVALTLAANLGTTSATTPITASVSLAPTGSSNIPNFVTNPTVLTGNTFTRCNTSLLFPFVTNQAGFDTGIAIANTSSDPFSTTGQAGTCVMNFYGSGAPAAVTTASIAAGTVGTQVISGVAAGFQGYVIATCNFQFAHGFAYITNGFTSASGQAEGYLALVLNSGTGGARTVGTGAEALNQ